MLSRRSFIHTSVLGSLAVAARARAAATRGRTNLIVVTADDLHGDAMEWSGGMRGISPHLDYLARQSIGFVHTHAAAPICQPSRSALMSGLVPHRNGAVGFNDVRPDIATLPEILGRAGYFTAGLNKLKHMTPKEKFPWDWRRDRAPGQQTPSTPGESNRNPRNYRRDVLEAIAAARAARKAFFINANIVDPHRPFYLTPLDVTMGGAEAPDLPTEPRLPGFLDDLAPVRDEVRRYYRSARRCDESFGEIMTALNEARVLDDTLIVFVADHGMPFPFSKTTLYAGGTWTPCLICPPGGARGHRTDGTHFVSNTDIMPTVLEALGIEIPPGLDGRSLEPLIRGEGDARRLEVCTHVTSTSTGDLFPSRCWRNARESYIWNAWSDGKTKFDNESMRGATYPAMAAAAEDSAALRERVNMLLYRTPDEFYDLTRDPFERSNLVTSTDRRSGVTAAREKLRSHMAKTSDPLLPQFERFLARA